MDKNSIRKLCWAVAASSVMLIFAGCSEPAAPKPWDDNAFSQTSFTFSDNDPAENVISGDIKVAGIPQLKGVQSYLVYWGDSSSELDKSSLLKEIPGTPSGDTLYVVPNGTQMEGSYFLLFLKTTDNKEYFSGKSLAIDDLSGDDKQPQKSDALSSPDSVLAPVTTPNSPSSFSFIVINDVLFEFDKFNIRQDYKQQLLDRLDSLPDKDIRKFLIAGHADERGSNTYNLALGERRAYAVKRFLMSMGFLEENMKTVSYGEEKPVDYGHNEDAWARNRRVETSEVQ
jgi:peptidoglycan-associated lipoprotein